MKIVILTNYANGLYLFRRELIEQFHKRGHTVLVSVPPDEQCKKIEQLGCQVIPTMLERRSINPIKDFKLFCFYMGLLKREKPDAVLTYTIKPNLYGGLGCRLRRVPYLCNITGLGTAIESGTWLSRILLIFYKAAVAKAKRVFFQNESNRQFMQEHGIAKKNSMLLPGSGVNLKQHTFETYPSEEDGIRILTVIRIMREKGIEEYLEMVSRLAPIQKNVLFFLAGEYEEEEREKYEPIIHRLEEEKVLKYLGHVNNVHEVMAGCHAILHPSYHEGLSNVLLEGAACGRPLLASDVPGCRETMQPDVSGMLFAPCRVDAMTEVTERFLLLGAKERERMGMTGRKWVEAHFDREMVLAAYEEELQKITEAGIGGTK